MHESPQKIVIAGGQLVPGSPYERHCKKGLLVRLHCDNAYYLASVCPFSTNMFFFIGP